ncbi:MAG: class I SAM-dependent methyltransferase [Chloroflexota bacterium]|nr:class I SAM-dependent methyltransferase [Chloroflexota bacterium]
MSGAVPDRDDPGEATDADRRADDAVRAEGRRTIEGLDRALADGEVSEADWYVGARTVLEASYLATDDPYLQSGMRADATRWERGRRPIVAAVDRDGTFLDVGCANGLLMASTVAWATEARHRLEPYGLDHSPALADLARRRLPQWADRIFAGNVIDWRPPFRFDFVRTELEYVPPVRQPALVGRLLRKVVAPGGRLIVCAYGSSRPDGPRAEPISNRLRGWGFAVAGEADGADDNGVVFVRVAWLDAPPDRSLP